MSRAAANVAVLEPLPDGTAAPALLEPDIVLPERLGHLGRRCAMPEHRLMLAVLEDAVYTYQVCCASRTTSRHVFRETMEWFGSDDTPSPFCFVTICELFGVEPDYVRLGLRRWRERYGGDLPGPVPVIRIRNMRRSRHRVSPRRPAPYED
jgi:hypothetical protein